MRIFTAGPCTFALLMLATGVSASGVNGRALPFEPGYFPGLDVPRVVAAQTGVEVTADDRPLAIEYPVDRLIVRTVLVKNTTSERLLVTPRASMSFAGFDASRFSTHPQAEYLYLDPGQSQPFRFAYELPDPAMPGSPAWVRDDRISVTMSLGLRSRRAGAGQAPEFTITLPAVIAVVRSPRAVPLEPAPNATLTGQVTVVGTGAPVANTPIEFVPSLNQDSGTYRTQTDASGHFSLGVYAFERSGGSPSWQEYTIRRVQPPRLPYSEPVVVPVAGATTTVSAGFPDLGDTVAYEREGTIDLGLPAYAADAAADGRTIATAPFHVSTLPASVVEARAKLNVFTADGVLLFEYPLRGQTPAVDVSDDGALIATTRQTPDPSNPFGSGGTAVVFDRSGRVLLEVPPLSTDDSGWGDSAEPIMEVRLSRGNQYLAVGDRIGRVALIDVATGRQVWRAFAKGQVRRIDFDVADERVFVSGGDGWLRAFSMTGALLWQAWVDSWVTALEISNRYVLAISKAHRGGLHLIDKRTGSTRWSYQTNYAANKVMIAPDEAYVWAASAGPSINTIFSIDGVPQVRLAGPVNAAAVSADGTRFAYSDGCTVSVVDGQWRALFQSGDLVDPMACVGNHNYLVSMLPDASRVAVAAGTQSGSSSVVHFFRKAAQ